MPDHSYYSHLYQAKRVQTAGWTWLSIWKLSYSDAFMSLLSMFSHDNLGLAALKIKTENKVSWA